MRLTGTLLLAVFLIFCVKQSCSVSGIPHPPKAKPGVCPYSDAFCHGETIGNQCRQDDECPGARKCCPGPCGEVCLIPEKVKPGVCPAQYTVCRAAFDICDKDDECPGDKKCCEGSCGTECRTPEIEKPNSCPEEVANCVTLAPYECNNDSECRGVKKCCFVMCALRCVKP